LIAIGGLSGTGKTTLAHALAPNLGAAPGAVHLRSDVIRKEHWGVDEQDRLSPEAYDPEVSERVYNTIQARSREVLTGGQTVIADAVYARPHERDELEAVARQLGIPFHGIWLSTETDTLIRRVTQRTADASDATEAVVRQQLDYDTDSITWQSLNAGSTPRQLLKAAEAVLRT
jgi:predicted kinase